MSLNNTILGIAAGLLLLAGGVVGYMLRPIFDPYPVSTNHTEYIRDTAWYPSTTYVPWVIRDTIKLPGDPYPVPANVDTAAILKDYFTIYGYPWAKQDTNLSWKLYTVITQNKPIRYDFSYQILRAQTINNTTVDNSISYASYLQAGLSIPVWGDSIKKLTIDLTYSFPKGYAGVGYQPETNAILVKAGLNILKFNKRK